MKRNLLLILCLVGLFGIGLGSCSDDTQPSEAAVQVPVDTLPTVFMLTRTAYYTLLDSLKGNIVLVNVYTYGCVPCMQELPAIIQLQEKYAAQGVYVLLLSADRLSVLESHVRPNLYNRGVEFPTYIIEHGDWGSLKDSIDPAWTGAVPFTVILDREGGHRSAWVGSAPYSKFEEHVLALM